MQYLYPAVVAAVSFAFAALVLRQYVHRRRPQQAVWALSLFLSGVGAVAFILSTVWLSLAWFRVYYLTGALLMAALLGQGSLYMALPRRVAGGLLWALVALGAVGAYVIFRAPADLQALRQVAATGAGAGVHVLDLGPGLAVLILMNTYGTVGVFGVALWSAWRVLRRRSPGRLLLGNALIAGGTLINAAAGTMARVLQGSGAFWVTLAAGTVVLFAGFLAMPGSALAQRPDVAREGSGRPRRDAARRPGDEVGSP
ncbi:hypothetical protein [Caldinitratiruptor microaerophilus]|uniref:Uncharacterized protein n=1 Tax=Caldinitratiruptor microaerophilus TaxID=671077 RepID=A0AA35CM12_9FIRM|nr:hypothetical protein [Caldinitratiruptor microaerophilus]BDG60969.1 hypothetical protein caldi_20590 [Caldinitratiruptor microaerophilus]